SSSSQPSSAPTDIAKDKFDKPVQPEGITFPSHMFGSNKRSFQHTCFLKLHSRHIELLQSRMISGPKNATLLSHDYQNSMLSILAKSVMDYIINEVKEARYFTIMVDETKDISIKEQLALILCYVLKGVIH
ncbi:PREDICTED: uncharacterized protein LOC105316267, partial [Amphimedon queenslandica]|uniref:DUF4371 domain-containing protein n=1 Tax=Amphimedon queenslandica TaxID=400682 RepID=A0AAN0IUA3_AMPQE